MIDICGTVNCVCMELTRTTLDNEHLATDSSMYIHLVCVVVTNLLFSRINLLPDL